MKFTIANEHPIYRFKLGDCIESKNHGPRLWKAAWPTLFLKLPTHHLPYSFASRAFHDNRIVSLTLALLFAWLKPRITCCSARRVGLTVLYQGRNGPMRTALPRLRCALPPPDIYCRNEQV